MTTICENYVFDRGLLGEHGLSVLVEVDEKKLLFDAGAGLTLLHNAGRLEIGLKDIRVVVLSHGHFDHTGGLKALLEVAGQVKAFAHEEVFGPKYRIDKGQPPSYIGVPWPRQELEGIGAQFVLNRAPLSLYDRVLLTGEIPRTVPYEEVEARCHLKEGEVFVRDPVRDDQALVVETRRGVCVILGCAHSGVVNTLNHVVSLTGVRKVYAVIGGMHLAWSDEDRIMRTLRELDKLDVQLVAPCHCTGFRAIAMMHQAFGRRFVPNCVGASFKFE